MMLHLRGDHEPDRAAVWPSLPFEAWRDTYATLHRWTQIVGKTRLALAPMMNHWWHVALYVTTRGLTTSPMPYGVRTLEVELDFAQHRLVLTTSEGASAALALAPCSVSEFHAAYLAAVRGLGVEVSIWPMPVEIADAVPFPEDREHASYDREYANRFWRIVIQVDRVLKRFGGRFLGKASPVHFFWGSFDLAATRFSGRRAPPHPGGVPNVADRVMREAYSHEVISVGFWPGGGAVAEAACYAYAYPEPAGFAGAPIEPEGAYYSRELGEFILPYEVVRAAPVPDEAMLAFFQSAYAAAADRAGWDRRALDRPPADWPV